MYVFCMWCACVVRACARACVCVADLDSRVRRPCASTPPPHRRRSAQRHIMNRHAGALRLTTSTKFKLHLNKVTRIFEIKRK
ncbi:hypothetical protein T492DRAFT_1108823 [Pavlovales sp. CCMP2436]|nr:hypothetical protein T492DRAFT_1108823 [Pavlovales sp. CCMP2436]